MTSQGVDAGLRLARLCKALGHPARVRIMHYLRSLQGGRTCGEIVDQLPLAQSTVSQHIKVLRQAGLLRGEAQPPRVRYRIEEKGIEELKRAVAAL